MRYKEGEAPDPQFPHTMGMHASLSVSVILAFVIGAILLYLGIRGNVMWLKYWSAALMLASVCYLVADAVGLF